MTEVMTKLPGPDRTSNDSRTTPVMSVSACCFNGASSFVPEMASALFCRASSASTAQLARVPHLINEAGHGGCGAEGPRDVA
jgi:hypothetical protein